MGRKTCAISECYNTAASKNVSFYSFTKRNIESRQKWLEVIGEEAQDVLDLYVCSDHFTVSDFINASNKAKGIREFAVPSLKVGGKQTNRPEIILAENIPVGANEEVGIVTKKRKAAEVVPNNRGWKKERKITEILDHDYSCSIVKYKNLLKLVRTLKEKTKRLRKKSSMQSQTIKRKNVSIQRWKQKASLHKKKIRDNNSIISDTVLAELQRNAARPPNGARYSEKTKAMALGLYYCSTRAYRAMLKIFRLPSMSLIKTWLKNLKIDEGFNQNVQIVLREKAKLLLPSERVVSIAIDEMSLRPNITYLGKAKPDIILGFPSKLPNGEFVIDAAASSVLVIMMKGMKSGFKQSIGYFFSKNGFKAADLIDIIRSAVDFVESTGFMPKLVVCDQNATNRSLFTKLGVTVENPYFVQNGNKLYCLFDPPHLLKSSRNNLIHHNAVYENSVIKWDHIRSLYDEDSKRLPRTAPKLSNKHVFLPAFGEMRVGVAAETLSATVAAAIKMYITKDVLAKECLNTTKYIEDIDKLFDIFNASDESRKPNKVYLKPLTHNSIHWKFLEEIERKLQNLKFVDKQCETLADEKKCKPLPKQSREPWFIQGWLLDISSITLLFEDLSNNYGFEKLQTRALNQDCLENFFGIIRMANATNDRPDVFGFKSAYRAAAVNQLLHVSDKSNSEQDIGVGLFKLQDFSKLTLDKLEQNIQPAVQLNLALEEFDSSQINNINYTAGWITSTITHEECLKFLENDIKSCEQNVIFASLKSSEHQAVSEKLERFLTIIVSIFTSNFENLLRESPIGVKRRIADFVLENDKMNFLCDSCKESVIDRYINMLMKAKVKELNESLKIKKKSNSIRTKSAGTSKAKKLNIC